MTRGARVTSVLFHFSFETESAKSLPETHIYSCIFRRRTSNASPHPTATHDRLRIATATCETRAEIPFAEFRLFPESPFLSRFPRPAVGVVADTDAYHRLLTYSTLGTKSATPFSSSRRSARPRALSAPTTLRATTRGRPDSPTRLPRTQRIPRWCLFSGQPCASASFWSPPPGAAKQDSATRHKPAPSDRSCHSSQR